MGSACGTTGLLRPTPRNWDSRSDQVAPDAVPGQNPGQGGPNAVRIRTSGLHESRSVRSVVLPARRARAAAGPTDQHPASSSTRQSSRRGMRGPASSLVPSADGGADGSRFCRDRRRKCLRRRGSANVQISMVVLDDRSRPVVAGHGDRMVVMNRRLVVLRGFVASLNRRRCRIPARS